MKKVLISIGVIIILIILYGFLINPKGFKVVEKNIPVETLVESFNGFTIAQISDILIGSTKSTADLEKIVTKINEQKPDIIVFTGDLISKDYKLSEKEIDSIKKSLKKLDCTLYKYAIMGDNDEKQLETFQDIMKNSDFTILNNESTYLFYKDNKPIKITGITDINNVDKSLEIVDNLETTMNLVLTHYPDYIDTLKDYDVDVVLAGHSLKGQIRIPFIGGIMGKANAKKYKDDYYQVDNTKMYVSGGLGTETIQFRLFNKPEINIYRLTAK